MDHDAILKKVISVTSDSLGIDASELDETTDFKQLGADSFDLLELVTAFEDEFQRTMDDDRLMQIATIGDAVKAIEEAM
ncbi:MAG: acyl carrier protein [Atopobiaceae bacterium]|nr:acyl carrier protein [Atopobiaceae bacterium]